MILIGLTQIHLPHTSHTPHPSHNLPLFLGVAELKYECAIVWFSPSPPRIPHSTKSAASSGFPRSTKSEATSGFPSFKSEASSGFPRSCGGREGINKGGLLEFYSPQFWLARLALHHTQNQQRRNTELNIFLSP